MSRTVAVVWHASFSIAAGVLYFFFVLPRWPELLGDTSHTLGTVLRIVTGVLIGLAALPVVFTLLRTRRPEFGTPQLALRLRTSSIALHVLAGVLILGTAISEIWLSLDSAGSWLFGIYGAAAAIALLGIFAFYLAFVAELPPPPPKPLKPKKAKRGRRGRKADEDAEEAEEATDEAPEAEDEAAGELSEDETEDSSESESDEKPVEVTAEAGEPESTVVDETAVEDATTDGGLRNRRRRRLRGRVAVED
jgi:MFS family permease